jgi:hypothetical protein
MHMFELAKKLIPVDQHVDRYAREPKRCVRALGRRRPRNRWLIEPAALDFDADQGCAPQVRAADSCCCQLLPLAAQAMPQLDAIARKLGAARPERLTPARD